MNRVTQETPNRLMLGREVVTPITLLAPPAPGVEAETDWVQSLHKKFRDTHELVVETTKASHRADQVYADRRNKGLTFQVDSLVWLYEPKPRKRLTPKLDANRWSGPWIVLKVISQRVYLIKKVNGNTRRIVNVDRLSPYQQRDGERFPMLDIGRDEAIDNEGSRRVDDVDTVSDTGEERIEDEDNSGAVDVEATHSDEEHQPQLTVRARRQRRRPAWTNAFEL